MISVIGLGAMGSAVAGAFVEEGYSTSVWNRSVEKAAGLVEKGAVWVGDVGEVVAGSELVVVCVSDYLAFFAVLEPVRDRLGGKVLVNLTSGLPSEARAAAEWARGAGARYLDGAVLGVPPGVGRRGSARLFYSGDQGVFVEYEEVLGALGAGVFFGADPGAAARYDLALLGILWGTLTSALQGFALAGTAEGLLPYVEEWVVNVVLPSVRGAARQVEAGEYGGAMSPVLLNAVGLGKMLAAGQELGVRVDLMRPVKEFLERRVADGFGADSLAGMYEVIRDSGGPDGVMNPVGGVPAR